MKYKYSIIDYRDDGLYFKKIKLPEEIAPVEVMLYDMEGFSRSIFSDVIKDVITGKIESTQYGGNIVDLHIRKDYTTVYNLFARDGVLEGCTIETEELLLIIELWIKINIGLLDNS